MTQSNGWRGGHQDFPPRKCSWCGTEFSPTTHHNIYCSPDCAWRSGKAKNKEHIIHPNGNTAGEVTRLIIAIGIRRGQTLAQIAKELDRPVEQIKEIYEGVRNER